jgi:hypothetical protein
MRLDFDRLANFSTSQKGKRPGLRAKTQVGAFQKTGGKAKLKENSNIPSLEF